MSEIENNPESKVRDRSPNFPSIGLKEAIEKVKLLYEADKMAGSSRESAFKHLGYNGANGASLGVLGALKQFDLIREENKRIFVTENARTILLLPESDERRIKAIKTCALSPKKFKEVLERYKNTGFPSDDTLKSDLIFDSGFNDKSAQRFVFTLNQTLDFAGIKKDEIEKFDEDFEEVETEKPKNDEAEKKKSALKIMQEVGFTSKPQIQHQPSMQNAIIKEYEIPRRGNKLAVIQIEKPFYESDYNNIKAWLELFKDTLIDGQEGQVYQFSPEEYEGKNIVTKETIKEHFGIDLKDEPL